jgi:hypothetical protein
MSTPSKLHRNFFAIALSMALVAHAQAAETVSVKPDPAHSLAQKFAEPSRTAQATVPTQPKTKNERPSLEYEMEMLRRARVEAEERKTITNPMPANAIADTKTGVVEPSKTFSLTNRTPQVKQIDQKSIHAANELPLEPEKSNSPPPTPTAIPSSAETVPVQKSAVPKVQANATRATLLLVMDENFDTTKSTPDPILCLGDTCHVSSGFERAAVNIERKDTKALTNSRAASANSCMGHSACVFRDVPIPEDAIVEVIDLGSPNKFESHNGYSAEVDRSCKMSSNKILSCEHPLSTSSFRVWIVPEDTAKSAGAAALETAIVEGLPHMNVSRAEDK